jgi:5-methylcytosine-specific restriction endonuclease McrA
MRARKRSYEKVREAAERAGRKIERERVTIEYLLQRDHSRCGICGQKISAKYEWPHRRSASIDHIVPVSKGGAHVKANLRPAHLECNQDKAAGFVPGGEQLLLIG